MTDLDPSFDKLRAWKYESVGDPDQPEFFGEAVVAFIDVLGFTNAVRSSWGNGEQSPLRRLLRIKDAATNTDRFGVVAYTPLLDVPGRIHKARVHTVSDSIIICSALPTSGGVNDFLGALTIVICGIMEAWCVAIAEGFTIRGAVELGGIFWNGGETIGPAFLDAYKLELCVAKTSRVILGTGLTERLIKTVKDDWGDLSLSQLITKSDDGLLRLRTTHPALVSSLGSLKILRERSGAAAHKYDELINELSEHDPSKANKEDMETGLQELLLRTQGRLASCSSMGSA